jgi:hypothetical protein
VEVVGVCFSRRQWFEELAQREREDQELRDLLDREPKRPEPTFVADADEVTEAPEREPAGAPS